jgi:hypothetical protein
VKPKISASCFFVICFVISAIMSIAKVRSDCRYNEEEMSKILRFKSNFISSNKTERIDILKDDICPGMFNYWEEIGKVYTTKETELLTKVFT